jgi:catechol 2,3-dioxygenase-like lactoylglutathione lyase family enzyme
VIVPELVCSDIDRSIAFYERLGFRVRYARVEERFALLERGDGGGRLMLEQPLSADRLFPRAPLEHPYGRGVNLEIEVDDVEAVWEAAGVADPFLPLEERTYARADDEVRVRQFAIQDPDGYVLRFSQTVATRPR